MKLTTNIVLTGNHGRTQPYVIQLEQLNEISEFVYIHQNDESWPGEHAMLFNNSVEKDKWLSRKGNEWYEETDDRGGVHYNLKKSKVRIYFPQYSADTFVDKCTYIMNLSMFMHGTEIELGCFKFRRSDALACPPTRFDGMDEYYECMDFEMPDPDSIYYNFNEESPEYFIKHNISDTAAMVYASLYVVDYQEDKYTMKDGWTGAQNNMSVSRNNDMRMSLKYNPEENCLNMQLLYSNSCGSDLFNYLNNIYYTGNGGMLKWDLVIMDKDDIYLKIPSIITSSRFDEPQFTADFTNDFINSTVISADFNMDFNADFNSNILVIGIKLSEFSKIDDIHFLDSWKTWKDGLYFRGSVSIYGDDSIEDDFSFATLFSNMIPITQNMFAKLLDHDDFPEQINLDELNMNDITINAINKIEKNIKNLTYKVESQKNHMIQPVFYQTREIGNVVIHPAVTENIALNLETYKPYVKRFLIQVEGISFKEIGRTSQGIVFKVFGNMLPKSVKDGILYVLDQDMNLVTTGKYKYSM